MYFTCDVTREDRADELVAEVLAPLYEAEMSAGRLTSWTWLKHNVGGERRRLLALTAADHKTLTAARMAIVARMGERRYERARRELGTICPRHEDYMWDIRFETP